MSQDMELAKRKLNTAAFIDLNKVLVDSDGCAWIRRDTPSVLLAKRSDQVLVKLQKGQVGLAAHIIWVKAPNKPLEALDATPVAELIRVVLITHPNGTTSDKIASNLLPRKTKR